MREFSESYDTHVATGAEAERVALEPDERVIADDGGSLREDEHGDDDRDADGSFAGSEERSPDIPADRTSRPFLLAHQSVLIISLDLLLIRLLRFDFLDRFLFLLSLSFSFAAAELGHELGESAVASDELGVSARL